MSSKGRVTAVLGPTNTGKTHYAIERMLGHRTGGVCVARGAAESGRRLHYLKPRAAAEVPPWQATAVRVPPAPLHWETRSGTAVSCPAIYYL